MDKEENAVVPTLEDDSIRSRILTIRGVQVMLDRDLAELYGVPTKRLNEQVKRNSIRFPANFMFPLNDAEIQDIFIGGPDTQNRSRSQIATLNKGRGHNIKYRPNVFTEHGIIMLASVLKSEIAALVSIRITNTFVEMRKTLSSIAPLLARIEATDRRQIADQIRNDANQVRNEERFKLILNAMQDKSFPPQKIFYDGQIYDAFEQMKRFVLMARQELIVIDPFFDDSVLPLIAQKRQGVSVLVVKNGRKGLLHDVDVARFNAQYGNTLTVKKSKRFHDRFLVIDRTMLIHVGASFNYLGKKCFAFSSMDKSNIPNILAKI